MPVLEGDTAWDLVARYCSRQRGRGIIFVDWDDDSAAPTGLFSPHLTINPQTFTDITYTKPAAGGTATIDGAGTAGTAVTVDLIGDHRVVAEDFRLSGRYLHVADAVETTSENIQVLVTMSYFDGEGSGTASIERKWDNAREAVFEGLDPIERRDEAWWPLWHLHGIPSDWGGKARDHNGGTLRRVDFYCDNDGLIPTADPGEYFQTSPILCRILPDLPLYEGYDYATASPKRKIGDQVTYDEDSQPSRRPSLVLIRTGTDRYLNGNSLANGQRALSVQVRGKDILVACHSDGDAGERVVADIAGLGSTYDLNQLGITVGIELPHRVRRKTLRDGVTDPKRLITIRLPNLHLWLAHSGAIWDLDNTTRTGSSCAPLRAAGGGSGATPGILRDDRDTLSRLHQMACSWYLTPRQTAHWTLRSCGLLPSFNVEDDDGAITAIPYPTIGQLVTQMDAAGQEISIQTPITSVSYNHTTGQTTWETDWQELDFT